MLSYAREKCSGRLIAVFGSVGGRCIGRRSDLAEIAERYADISIVTSDNSAQECASDICEEIRLSFIDKSRVVSLPDRAEAIRYAYEISLPNDMILLLGKGHERYQLVGRERVYFSEKEILFSMGAVPYSINES